MDPKIGPKRVSPPSGAPYGFGLVRTPLPTGSQKKPLVLSQQNIIYINIIKMFNRNTCLCSFHKAKYRIFILTLFAYPPRETMFFETFRLFFLKMAISRIEKKNCELFSRPPLDSCFAGFLCQFYGNCFPSAQVHPGNCRHLVYPLPCLLPQHSLACRGTVSLGGGG